MTINANNSTTPASATGRVVSSANTMGHGPVQPGTPSKTLPMTPQVKQSIAAVRSAYNTYQRSGGKESIQAWLQPQIEEVVKERETTSAQTLKNKLPTEKPMDDVGIGTALGILADALMAGGGPMGLVVGAIIDGVIAGSGGGSTDGGGGSGDGSYGDNPGGGSPA